MNKQLNVCRYCLYLEGNISFLFNALALIFHFLDGCNLYKGLKNQPFLSTQEEEPLYVCRPLLQRSESGKRQ